MRRTDMNKDYKMRNQKMKFLDKRLMALVIAVGLCSPLIAQDANKVADEALKNKPESIDPEKVKKIEVK